MIMNNTSILNVLGSWNRPARLFYWVANKKFTSFLSQLGHDGNDDPKEKVKIIWKFRKRNRHLSLLWKSMKKLKKKKIRQVCKNWISGPGGDYVCGRYYHPHNAHPKTVALIKENEMSVILKMFIFPKKRNKDVK